MTCFALIVTLSLVGLFECFVVPNGVRTSDESHELSSIFLNDQITLKSISNNLTSFSYLSNFKEYQQLFRLNMENFVMNYCWTIDRLDYYDLLNVTDHIEREMVNDLEENLIGLQIKLRLIFYKYHRNYEETFFNKLTRYCLIEKEMKSYCGLNCALLVSSFFIIPLVALFLFHVFLEHKHLVTKSELVYITLEPQKFASRNYRTFSK